MKKLYILLILCCAFVGAKGQKKIIDSFLGVKLRSTKPQVISGLNLKGARLDKENGDAKTVYFDDVKIANRSAEYLCVNFVENQAYMASFVFKSELEANTIDFYNRLVDDLNLVYGKGASTKTFKSPFTDGDGEEMTAIQTGNAVYRTVWGQDDETQPGAILLMITDKLEISLNYIDKKLFDVEDKQSSKKNRADL